MRFDKLFKQKHLKNTNTADTKDIRHEILINLIFDKFKQVNLSIEEFEETFANIVKAELRPDSYFSERVSEAEREKDITDLWLFSAITYLSYYHPDIDFIIPVLEYLFEKDNKNEVYRIKSFIKDIYYRHFKEEKTIKDIINKSASLLKLVHAIYLQKDHNFSYYTQVRDNLSALQYTDTQCFKFLFDFIKTLEFESKYDFFAHLYQDKHYNYKLKEYDLPSVYLEEIRTLGKVTFEQYNKKVGLNLDFDLYVDLTINIFQINNTKTFKSTDYKKRRFLKANNFEEVQLFNEKYKNRLNEVLTHFVYHFRYSNYIEHTKLLKLCVTPWVKSSKKDKDWFKQLLDISPKQYLDFQIANIFTPLFAKHLDLIKYDGKISQLFESKLFYDLKYYEKSFAPIKKGTDLLMKLAETLEDKALRAFHQLKYTGYYSCVNSPYFYNALLNDKKYDSLKSLVQDLSVFFQIALKKINKNFYDESSGMGLMKVNIEGADQDLQWSQINELLQHKSIPFQLVSFPIIVKPRRDTEYFEYYGAMAFMNKAQFQYLITEYIPNRFPDFNINYAYDKRIMFVDETETTFAELKQNTQLNTTNENAFITDTNWNWFKDRYIDTLESKADWYEIMAKMLDCKGTKRPNKTWLKEILVEIKKIGQNRFITELNVLINDSIKEDFWFLENNSKVLKGFVWLCEYFKTEKSILIIKTIIENAYKKVPGIGPRGTKIGNLGLAVLVDINSNQSFVMLNLLRNKTKYQRFIKAIDKHLALFMEQSEEDEESLTDKSIPNFGFIEGVKKIIYKEFEVEFLFKNGKLAKKWWYDGVASNTMPKQIKSKFPAKLKEVNEEFKSINNVYKHLNQRITSFWLNNRKWTFLDWKTYLLDNQILNPWLQNMVWKNETSNNSFFLSNNSFLAVDNTTLNVKEDDIISLWHPVIANSQEIEAWQKFLIKNKITQRIRQVFRENYPFSENELKMETSPRFNDHFLEVRKLMAIANATGWIFTYVHEDVNWPRTYIKHLDLTAHLICDYNRNDVAIPTKGFYFTKGNTTKITYQAKFEKVKFKDIPPTVRTEICRNIDLFIAKTSIANDIKLSKRSEILEHYREDFNYGKFSENASAAIRKDTLKLIYEKIGLKSCHFEGNFLVVKGSLNNYLINLGSGFVQQKNTKRHINLIASTTTNKKVNTPMKDDETLNIIIAKALFLQNDHKIKDETILKVIQSV